MPGRGRADVVFCLDSSGSMEPCIEGVKAHIGSFVKGLEAGQQGSWDVRFEVLSHRAGGSGRDVGFEAETLKNECAWEAIYGQTKGEFFTRDIADFQKRISRFRAYADEANFIALDFCLDMPWRTDLDCHRVVVLLTDEPLETGVGVRRQSDKITDLIVKIQALRVMLFIIGPESEAYEKLAEVDRSEYEVVDCESGAGLQSVPFGRVLENIGRSVSISNNSLQRAPAPVTVGLFGQPHWGTTSMPLTGS